MTLKADILSDIATMLDTDEFAVTATWNATSVNGIFDAEFDLAELGDIGVEGNKPVFICASANVVGIAQGDTFVVGGNNYKVVREEADSTGVSTIILEDAA